LSTYNKDKSLTKCLVNIILSTLAGEGLHLPNAEPIAYIENRCTVVTGEYAVSRPHAEFWLETSHATRATTGSIQPWDDILQHVFGL
jgi:hypothetical protein